MQDDTTQPSGENAVTGSPADSGTLIPPDLRATLSTALIAIGCVLMMLFIYRMLRRKPGANAAPGAAPVARTGAKPGSGAQQAQDRIEQLMADAEELTRRLAAILDNKAARLEVLIQQADDRVRKLESAAAAAAAPKPERAPERPRPAEPEHRDPVDPFHRKVYELADQGLTPIDIARKIDRPTGQVELILALRRA